MIHSCVMGIAAVVLFLREFFALIVGIPAIGKLLDIGDFSPVCPLDVVDEDVAQKYNATAHAIIQATPIEIKIHFKVRALLPPMVGVGVVDAEGGVEFDPLIY